MEGAVAKKEKEMKLTKLELEIMEAYWKLGSASVREVQEAFPERGRPAYTTVQTIVYRLEEKGALRRVKRIGNAYVFEAAITREMAQRRLIDELLELLGNSTRPLMAHLIETGRLTMKDIRELESTLSELDERIESDAARAQKGSKKGSGK